MTRQEAEAAKRAREGAAAAGDVLANLSTLARVIEDERPSSALVDRTLEEVEAALLDIVTGVRTLRADIALEEGNAC